MNFCLHKEEQKQKEDDVSPSPDVVHDHKPDAFLTRQEVDIMLVNMENKIMKKFTSKLAVVIADSRARISEIKRKIASCDDSELTSQYKHHGARLSLLHNMIWQALIGKRMRDQVGLILCHFEYSSNKKFLHSFESVDQISLPQTRW